MTERIMQAGGVLALAMLAGCGDGGAGNGQMAAAPANQTPIEAQQGQGGEDATAQKMLPCSVVSHAASAFTKGVDMSKCDQSVDPMKMPINDLIRILPDSHPSFYYLAAARLYEEARPDEAVFWMYAGQLRYRVRLACHPDLPKDMEGPLFGSLTYAVGNQLNQYASSDIEKWKATIRRVLVWDEKTRNGFEPKAPCAAHIKDMRDGLAKLPDQIEANRSSIEAQRNQLGL